MAVQHILVAGPDSHCPACGERILLGLAGEKAPRPGRVSACGACSSLIVTTAGFGFRLPTAVERARIEATGLGARLREDVVRMAAWVRTGHLPPKRCPVPQDEPIFEGPPS